jgi:hypothetical protein
LASAQQLPLTEAQARASAWDRERELLIRISVLDPTPEDDAAVEQLLDEPLDWNYIVVIAARHKVLQLVWHNLARGDWIKLAVTGSGLPEIWIQYIAQLYAMNRERNTRYLETLEELGEGFAKAGLRVVVLKGGALIGTMYPPEARLLNDLDFIACRSDAPGIKEHLFGLGYRFGVYDYGAHELRPLERRVERAWLFHNHTLPTFYKLSSSSFCPYYKVQVGFDFFDPFEEFSADTGAILARARQKHPSSRALIPSAEDMLINLCAHIFREGVSMVYDDYNINWQLTKMCDLRAFLRRNEDALDRSVFARHVDSMGLRPPMYFAFHYCRELYGDAMFDPWLELVDPGVEKGFLTDLRDGKRRVKVDGAFLERFFSVRGARQELRGGWSRQFEKFEWSAT